ncbi:MULTISPECIES: LLM class flavin-dependent oxidoreductase [unclassified Pseudonocardia]|uniref:LLM class flavin-dependent oxidoreductase n=1 Tax=unclassified Pseudonocardia TaxID=2619320 RepID=UPI001CF70BC4|nr:MULTISPECIES: LLM class flavin-dependent oxidoreductase [unclassified Pseudonocardia]
MAPPSFGVMLFTHRFPGQSATEVFALAADVAQAAEAHGFASVWTTEHHFLTGYGINPSATTLAAFLLGRTRRVRVGTAVTILPTHPPVHVAEQAALLDQLSGGRFDLGVGRAGPVVDHEVLGTGIERWRTGLPEALGLVLDSFTGRVSADSEHYRFREVAPGPEPYTRPHPPVHVAATSATGVELAARHGLPMLFFFSQTADEQARLVADYEQLTAARPVHGTAALAHVTDSVAEAERVVHERLAPVFASGYAEYVMVEEYGGPRPTPDELAAGILARQPIGPPELCVRRLVDLVRGSGAGRVLLHVESSGERDAVLANVERLATEVLPAVRKELENP